MTQNDKNLIDMVSNGQSGKYGGFIRSFAGRVRRLVELKNPLVAAIMVNEIDTLFEVFNTSLTEDIEWLKCLKEGLKLWHNEKCIANRLLGLKNDNEYDRRVFEKAVVGKFCMELKGKSLSHDVVVKTDFKTMVDLIEIGARQFARY